MKPKTVLLLIFLIVLLALVVCALPFMLNNRAAPATTAPKTLIANAGEFVTRLPPTPASPGQAISYDGLQVTIDHAELSTDYLTEYGSRREPPAGRKFLWVQVALKNNNTQTHDLPDTRHFSALYDGGEFKPIYGHRQGYADYTALDNVLYPGQSVVAWLRFDVPAVAKLALAQFAYLPTSLRVTYLSYAGENHPVFLWSLTP